MIAFNNGLVGLVATAVGDVVDGDDEGGKERIVKAIVNGQDERVA